ncbi:fluoride efflux transporter FluC [Staphylococcus auricularis]|uniref:Fluoride-specific ion channel FluC n=1 Tax=Staphylococcus auricularis TaxID=29379 RepID=A0ABX5IGZ2_9STAP|nr:CrcB family protein [Staphylococcus auricularis]MCE5038369.1 CrcB family protein [Staphylococcus auricularis]MEB6569111.1 CrcB family protein [Staphylococcus auricularis]PTH18150.1 camphor resistance protein CrcB [Staphylococcus auricularis]PTH28034.1 camphor resistance protein CrcB [Staphylococcus auricularis]
MLNLLGVFIGGGCGAVVRAWITDFCNQHLRQTIPVATLLVNLIGSLCIGIFAHIAINNGSLYALFIIGFLGGLTTFSTLMYELTQMLHQQQWLKWCAYSALQYGLCFVACFIGYFWI